MKKLASLLSAAVLLAAASTSAIAEPVVHTIEAPFTFKIGVFLNIIEENGEPVTDGYPVMSYDNWVKYNPGMDRGLTGIVKEGETVNFANIPA